MDERVTIEQAREALDSLDDFARMDVGVDAHGPRGVLERFIAQQSSTPLQHQLADAFDSFSNPAINSIRQASYHGTANGSDIIDAISAGFAAVAHRLRIEGNAQ